MNMHTVITSHAAHDAVVFGDIATFDEGVGVMPEFVWAFQTEAPRRFESLSTALAEGAADHVALHARRLRNNALNIGAVPLAEVCDIIEEQAQVGRLPLSAHLSALLCSEYDKAHRALAELGD